MESFRIIEKDGVILFCNASNLLIQMGKEEEKKIYIYRALGSRKRGRNKKKRRKGRRKKKNGKRK